MIRKATIALLATTMVLLCPIASMAENNELTEDADAEYGEYVRTDPFQQVLNYLFSGDPFQDSQWIILDRKNCITERLYYFESGHTATITIYWNHIDYNSIRFTMRHNWRKGVDHWHMEVSGSQTTIKIKSNSNDPTVKANTGNHKTYMLGLEAPDIERVKNALLLLFSNHCTGGPNAAF